MLQRPHAAARGRLPVLLHRFSARGARDPLDAPGRAPIRNLHSLPTSPPLKEYLCDKPIQSIGSIHQHVYQTPCLYNPVASFATDSSTCNGHTESAKDLYEKILQSTEAKSSPPNAWIWSLIEKCGNEADIDLLFQTLFNLRKFRLSSLRIPTNFNSHLCQRVAEACARSNAFDYGLKTLWKHNKYGLTPSVASANYLLKHAKEKNDYKLMKRIMYALQKNDLPLLPGTADLVFSICYNGNQWSFLSLYSRKFIDAGVKLHRSTFDTWMEFAANRGDAPSIWTIEELRSKSTKHQTLSSALSCAKGFLLERKPDSAAAIIHAVNQTLPDSKKHNIEPELQKLISDWSLKVVKRVKGDKALARSLKEDIPAMMDALTTMGLQVMVNMDEMKQKLAA